MNLAQAKACDYFVLCTALRALCFVPHAPNYELLTPNYNASFIPAMPSMIPSNTLNTGLLSFVAPKVEPMYPPERTAIDQKAMC